MKRKSVNKRVHLGLLLSWILLSECVGIIGSLFTVSAITQWYPTLIKPEFAPPNMIFGPVWTALYALMGYAAYRVTRLGWDKPLVRQAIALFVIHLFFNGLWSIIFFGQHNIAGAFADILILWGLIVVLIVRFAKLDRISAYLLAPYLAWVSFATLLNYSLWILNR